DLREQATQFIDHVPFENVASKLTPLPNGIKAYATNQELYETIKAGFEKQGFVIDSIFPAFVFGQAVTTAPVLNAEIANLILQNINAVRANNLLTQPIYPEAVQKKEIVGESEAPNNNKRLLLLLA